MQEIVYIYICHSYRVKYNTNTHSIELVWQLPTIPCINNTRMCIFKSYMAVTIIQGKKKQKKIVGTVVFFFRE